MKAELTPSQEFYNPEEERVIELAHTMLASADQYQAEIKGIPKMDPETSRQLAQKVQSGKEASKLLSKPEHLRAEQAMMLGVSQKEGKIAKWQLVYYHLRFAAYLARRSVGVPASKNTPQGIATQLPNYQGSILPLADRIQAANIGLEDAADTYKPDFTDSEGVARDANFTTYARYAIQRELILAIHREYPHLTSDVIKKGGVFRRREEELSQELGRVPTLDELIRALGWDEELSDRMMKSGIYAGRLTFKTLDAFKKPNLQDATRATDMIENRDFLIRALKYVDNRYRAVLTLRYGLLDGQEMNQEEVGEMLGVTLSRIQQIETRALSQIRKGLLKTAGLEGGPDSMRRLRDEIWE